jgi:hypothetical protein
MKNAFLQRRLARLEAKAKIGAEAIGERFAEALTQLSDDEFETIGRLSQKWVDSGLNWASNNVRWEDDLSRLTVDELAAALRWMIRQELTL